jgi:hypothetical protein
MTSSSPRTRRLIIAAVGEPLRRQFALAKLTEKTHLQ